MKPYPIENPVDGEEVLAVQPPLQPWPEAGWRERLAYFTGRALTHTDLRKEQRARSGSLAGLGRALSPGVVSGLEVVARTTAKGIELEIAAGLGLAANGEMISVPRNQRVELEAIRVYGPGGLFDEAGTWSGAETLGPPLGQLREAGRVLPSTLILLLQPVSIAHFDPPGGADPCEVDPSDEAFENWQWQDGARLLLYAWNPLTLYPRPRPMPPLPETPPFDPWLRNRAAYRVFEAEARLDEGGHLPWQAVGLPIALVGLDPDGRLAFIDRNSVVRRGGEARGDVSPVKPATDRFLQQARFEQFNEQLADWLSATPAPDPAGLEAAARFRFLPPVGVLPTQAMRLREPDARQGFFPPGYLVQARPVPYEQLDLAIEESAGLRAFDLAVPDRVEVLVPLPQDRFDPDLLRQASVAPEFLRAVAEAADARDRWLGRRETVRRRASALYRAIRGEPLDYPEADPEAVDEAEAPADFERDLLAGDEADCRYLLAAQPPRGWNAGGFDDAGWTACPAGAGGTAATAGEGRRVFQRFRFVTAAELPRSRRYVLEIDGAGEWRGIRAWLNGRRLRLRPEAGPVEGRPLRFPLGDLRGLLRPGDNLLAVTGQPTSLAGRVRLMDTEDGHGTVEAGGEVVSREFIRLREGLRQDEPDTISEADHQRLAEQGIEAFVAELKRRIARANDQVDFGFLRLRTDIYRVRQYMLGNEAATRLATSPALAEIARGESAVATRKDLAAFYERIKGSLPGADEGGQGGEGDGDGNGGTGSGHGTPLTAMVAAPEPTGTVTGGTTGGDVGSGERPSTGTSAAIATGEFFLSADLADTIVGTAVARAGDRSGSAWVKDWAKTPGLTPEATRALKVLQSDASLFKAASSTEDVLGETPMIGWSPDLTNVTVGQRLQPSSADLSYQAGRAMRDEVVDELRRGLHEQGFVLDEALLNTVAGEDFLADGDDNGAGPRDEGRYFDAGVRLMENVTRLLRHVESRVARYRAIVRRCEKSLARIRRQLDGADARLKVIGDELAEARHDVSVARALLAEETARVEAINARRDRLLAEQVPFLLFRRPRSVDLRRDVPLRDLDPDLSDQPLPLCDLDGVETPEPLAAMIDVLRDAPLRWFLAMKRILPVLSRPADLLATLDTARRRARGGKGGHALLQAGFQGGNRLWQGIGAALGQASRRVQAQRRGLLALDLGGFARMGWAEAGTRVPEVVSLGDVIDGNHGRFLASRRAAEELDLITRVATCLYQDFSAVPAPIRLQWAERLSQYDDPAPLRNLYSLPRFAELDYIARNDLQRLVDWLYGRVDERFAEARELIADLVRVALLAASHAPVDQLIAGHVAEPVTALPGGRIRLVADLGRVRIGMSVLIAGAGGQARGRVADIVDGQVMAEVTQAPAAGIALAQGASVQIGARLIQGRGTR